MTAVSLEAVPFIVHNFDMTVSHQKDVKLDVNSPLSISYNTVRGHESVSA